MRTVRSMVGGMFSIVIIGACSAFGAGSNDTDGGSNVQQDDGAVRADAPLADGPATSVADVAPDGPYTHAACDGEPDCPRYVFVTSTTSTGDMAKDVGGVLVSADARCTVLAGASGFPLSGRTFKAWLSNDNPQGSPSERLVHGTQPYVLRNGDVVALDWAAFASPLHPLPINQDENGQLVGNEIVWTATNANGTYAAPGCKNWNAPLALDVGTIGSVGAVTTAGWTNSLAVGCLTRGRIYCVEK